MPENIPRTPLDRLQWLLNGKPTASELEDLGGNFNPEFHFLALLPSSALPSSEANRAQNYFDVMLDALLPVRDSIAAYWLRGVMSRTPLSDFSLEIQFCDPNVAEIVRKKLPSDMSASVALNQRRQENTIPTQAGTSMFSRDKRRQQNADQTNSKPSQLLDATQASEGISQKSPLHFATIANPAPVAVLPQTAHNAPVRGPSQSQEPVRKKLTIAEGITIQGGEILGCECLAIEGEAYVAIDSCHKLEILENGIFKGSASVAEAEIGGYCKGTLVVKDTLRITGTGHVVGMVQYGRLQVEDGGRIEGEMKMPVKGNNSDEPEKATQSENPRWLDLNEKISSQSQA